MIIVLFGKPGAGKGTQAPLIASALGVPTLATGDVLRNALRAGTPLGLEAKGYMDRGELVPDRVILGIVGEELRTEAYAKGVVLDGAVRTVAQAEGLQQMLRGLGRAVDAVLALDVDTEEVVRRMGLRTVCDKCQAPYTGVPVGSVCPKCGGTIVRRKDDEPEAVRNRLRVFDEQTAPVLAWYRQHGTRVAIVDAVGDVADVTQRVLRAIGR